ncbi:amidase signature domain-containing protein [Colletotrichum cereale]|nr:amidase signature domain-containing protein [Colletotrichum cereale]
MTKSIPSHLLSRIANGTWSAESVARAFIKRAIIVQYLTNPMSDKFFESAIDKAKTLDEHLRATGKTVGPLHGLPISTKDVMNLRGRATTVGFIGLADELPDDSDDLLSQLMDVDAIFYYCKTNVPQGLMSGECANYLFGRTTSPYSTNLSAGGSSGGEGSLVALGGSPLGIGTDIAGSIRTPANFNGIYGLSPSYGRLPIHSPQFAKPSFINAVAGPMCRSIEGLKVYTRAVLATNLSSWDPTIVPMPWNTRAATSGLTFGIVPNDGIVRPHPPIERRLRSTAGALEAGGHQVTHLPSFFSSDGDMEKVLMDVIGCDGGAGPRSLLNRLPEPAHPETIFPEPSEAISAPIMISNGRRLLVLRKHFLDKLRAPAALKNSGLPVDVVILPSWGHVAPPHSTMDYDLYEAISNILDWSCATAPVGRVNPTLDPRPGLGVHANVPSRQEQLGKV